MSRKSQLKESEEIMKAYCQPDFITESAYIKCRVKQNPFCFCPDIVAERKRKGLVLVGCIYDAGWSLIGLYGNYLRYIPAQIIGVRTFCRVYLILYAQYFQRLFLFLVRIADAVAIAAGLSGQ